MHEWRKKREGKHRDGDERRVLAHQRHAIRGHRHLRDIELAVAQHAEEGLFDEEVVVDEVDALGTHAAVGERARAVVVPAGERKLKLGQREPCLHRHRVGVELGEQAVLRAVFVVLPDGQLDRAAAHALLAGSSAGIGLPSRFALAARSRRERVATIPLSVRHRCSRVRSWIGPIDSCSDASCMAMPSTPL